MFMSDFCILFCNFASSLRQFMQEKTLGIVLRLLKYNDESVIADIFTSDYGAMGFIVRLPRNRKSPLRTVLLRPLSILSLEFDYRPNQNLQRLRGMQVAVPYRSLPYEPMKEAVALFLSEFLYHALRHETHNPALFRYLSSGLQWLDETQEGVANFHLVFLMRMTRFLGFWPAIREERRSAELRDRLRRPVACFDLKEGIMTEMIPRHEAFLPPAESAMVPFILRMNFPTMHLFRMNREQRNRILDVLTDYYRLHVPEFPELKSLEILRSIVG